MDGGRSAAGDDEGCCEVVDEHCGYCFGEYYGMCEVCDET